MASDLNTVLIIGRLTRDSELRYTSSGVAMCNFSIASNRRVKKNDQWIDEVSFFDLTLWQKQAEGLQKYLVKGVQVGVHGELIQERWEKDSQKFSKLKINVNDVQLLGGKPQQGNSAPNPQPADDFDPQAYEDDIPF